MKRLHTDVISHCVKLWYYNNPVYEKYQRDLVVSYEGTPNTKVCLCWECNLNSMIDTGNFPAESTIRCINVKIEDWSKVVEFTKKVEKYQLAQ